MGIGDLAQQTNRMDMNKTTHAWHLMHIYLLLYYFMHIKINIWLRFE